MSNHTDKKDMFYIIILILTFITVIVGATFALYSLIFSQEEGTSAVYTGTLSIEYLSGDIINFNFLYPTEKPTIDTEKNVYRNNFRVTNTGSLDSLLQIEIEINNNQFSNKTVMYTLYDEVGAEISEGYIEGKKQTILARDVELTNNTTKDFTLLIWLNENGQNQNDEMKKKLTGTIKVDASQKID